MTCRWGNRAAGRARQLAGYRGYLPTRATDGDHNRGRGHGPDHLAGPRRPVV